MGGCAGRGEMVMLDPGTLRFDEGETATAGARGTVLIVPFDDERPEKGRIGKRLHVGGGHTYYTVVEDKPGRLIAQLLADYLTHRGWQASVSTGRPGPDAKDAMTVTGQVREFSADAESRPTSTEISVRMLVTLQSSNEALGTTGRMILQGSRVNKVAVFSDRHMEDALRQMIKESLDRLMVDASVENGVFQVK
jgi:hypothetical protein